VAKLLQNAAVAFGFAGDADLAAEVDELVAECDPAVLRNGAHQVLFDFGGGVGLGEGEAMGQPEDVGIDYDAFGLVEADSQDNIGGFAGGAGNGDQLGECLRDFAAKVGDDLLRGSFDGFGLVAEEAGGADEGFEIGQPGLGHGCGGREALEELRGDHVDADVGALRGEDCGDEKLPGRFVMESAFRVGVGFVEGLENGGDAVGGEVAICFAGRLRFSGELCCFGHGLGLTVSQAVAQIGIARFIVANHLLSV